MNTPRRQKEVIPATTLTRNSAVTHVDYTKAPRGKKYREHSQ